MKRRVLEVIASRRNKFPNDTLENHYLDWADVMQAWLDVRATLGEAAIEIEQLTMAQNANLSADHLQEFLGLSESQSDALRSALTNDRPEQTSAEVGYRLDLRRLALSGSEEREMKDACDPLFRAYGYDYGEAYFS